MVDYMDFADKNIKHDIINACRELSSNRELTNRQICCLLADLADLIVVWKNMIHTNAMLEDIYRHVLKTTLIFINHPKMRRRWLQEEFFIIWREFTDYFMYHTTYVY